MSPTGRATTSATPSTPTKIHRDLNWRPTETFASGMEKTVRWYLDEPRLVGAAAARQTYGGERLGKAATMILVFGGEGQVGRALVRAAAATRHRADRARTAGRRHHRRQGRSRRRSRERSRASIVNAAAYTAVDQAESEPDMAHRVNATGAGLIAAAADAAGVPIIHISTDYVFDGDTDRAYVEDDPVRPINVYGDTKEAGEQHVRAATPRHLILRTAWVFSHDGDGFVQSILKWARTQETLELVADNWGTPTAADDLAEAILAAASPAATGDAPWGTYHAAGAATASRYDFGRAIVEAAAPHTGRKPVVKPVPATVFPTRAPRPTQYGA